jgi:hypothetical protein
MELTEQNVSRASSFYDYLGRERERDRGSEGSKGRMEAIDAAIKAAGEKMSGSRE